MSDKQHGGKEARLTIRHVPLSDLKPHPKNPRRHPKPGTSEWEALKRSLSDAYFDPVVLNERNGYLVSGHLRTKVMREMGIESADAVIVDWDEPRHLARMVAANKLQGEDDEAMLADILKSLPSDLAGLTGMTDDELSGLVQSATRPSGGASAGDPEPMVDEAAELAAEWGVTPGQLWGLGEHRVLCGDSTKPEDVESVLGGEPLDMFLTDPPYCSGGFQEAGRAAGSIGTKRIGADGKEYTPRIHNDALSSRGYCALMKGVLGVWKPSFAYMFTDWRMWVQLFDVMESSGYGVRNMIVWDKGTPGMGMGWRSQHELVMFGAAAKPRFDGHKAQGNVIACGRTGNPDHPTQKPVDVLASILEVTDFCTTVGDPFCGSGSTVIACERLGRKCRAIEIDPGYVAVTLRRYLDATGRKPVLLKGASHGAASPS